MAKKEATIGNRKIGGHNPVLLQSMCNTKTKDIHKTVNQIKNLEEAGCQIIRVAVPDMETAKILPKIKDKISIPLVADIHFDYRIAIESCKHCDKIRINPGNIGRWEYVKEIINSAKINNCAIRIGVNMGSLNKNIEKKMGRTAEAMVESAIEYLRFFEKNKFENIVVSLKSSDVLTTIEANRKFAKLSDYPIHIGITEAGTKNEGAIRSSIGIGALLSEGIGDTIRVSLTEDPVEEVKIAHSILSILGIRDSGRQIISCPTCARTHGNLIPIAKEVEEKTAHIKEPIKIAIMGCEVNGPGEASDADFGVALSEKDCCLFRKGKITKKIRYHEVVKELLDLIENDK